MDIKFSPEEETFRLEIREWISDNLPDRYKAGRETGAMSSRRARMDWYKKLAAKGWLCTSWPKEHGGTGWTMAQQVIFMEEAAAQGVPGADMGVYMVGPLLIEYGTEEQKKRFLPKIASAEELWCQGYSEPNAGSDLANLALRADRDGDDYVLNGQKIWTSGAHEADWIFILARTNSNTDRRQQGISFLLAPMDSPGLRIEPIKQITDESHFYETFFTDVRVPVANRVGEENEGWTAAKRLLAHERVGLGAANTFRKAFQGVLDIARDTRYNGEAAIKDRTVRQKLAELSMQLDALGSTDSRGLTKRLQGQMPGPESSIIKLFGSEVYQAMCDLALEIQGPLSQLWDDENFRGQERGWPKTQVGSRAYSIFSGTSEIQRNIISERVLGLPR